MDWFLENDNTSAVITAKKHINSNHKTDCENKPLPENAMIFCLSKWDKILTEELGAYVYLEKLKRFLGSTQVYKINGVSDWCFLHGGAGSPQIADTIETIHALGVKNVVLVGMVGGFGENVSIGTVIVPNKILSEEGTSIHYIDYQEFAELTTEDNNLIEHLKRRKFDVVSNPTVTTDAVYKQTFAKEELWRRKGCVGVDCEASALVNICNYYKMKSRCIFIVSDKHPLTENEKREWVWGVSYEDRKKLITSIIDYYALNKSVVK